MKTVITLGDMQAEGMHMLEVACRTCERRGRLSIARLIAVIRLTTIRLTNTG